MASSNSEYSNPQAQPLRLPKLSYRTKSCDAESVSSASTTFTGSTASTTPTSPLTSNFCPSPRSPPSDMSLPLRPRQSSFAPSTQKASSSPTKKRPKFLSGLFGAKEPSAQALQDYQRRLMKQGGGRVTPVGMPGVSSAKLPATVPKVNSRWDGVPQTLKEKGRQNGAGLNRQLGTSKAGRSHHKAPSTADSSRRRSSRGTLGGVSVRSGSSNHLAELYGWETNSSHSGSSTINFTAEHRPATLRSVPPLQQYSSLPHHELPPSPASSFSPTEVYPPSPFGSPDLPSLSSSPMLTPFDSSPATPATPPPFINLTSPKPDTGKVEKPKLSLLETPDFADEVIVKSAGVNILGPPTVAKRKPKPTPLQPSEQRPKTSGAEFQFGSIPPRQAPVSKDTASSQSPTASYFPKIISTPSPKPSAKVPPRHKNTCETLDLSVNPQTQAIAPWLSPEQAASFDAKGERIITPTPEGGKSLRSKSRMALFKRS